MVVSLKNNTTKTELQESEKIGKFKKNNKTMNNIKEFLKVVLTGSTRTHVATFEQRELYSDFEVAKIINEKIKDDKPFNVSKNGKTYTIKNL